MAYWPRDRRALRLGGFHSGNRADAFEDDVRFEGCKVEDYAVFGPAGSFAWESRKPLIEVENLSDAHDPSVYGPLLRDSDNTGRVSASGAGFRVS